MRVLVHDRISYALTSRTITDEGYLLAPAYVARTGVQQYLASELELTDRNPNEIINVYRPPGTDRKSTRLNSSHVAISYAVFCLKKKNKEARNSTPRPHV